MICRLRLWLFDASLGNLLAAAGYPVIAQTITRSHIKIKGICIENIWKYTIKTHQKNINWIVSSGKNTARPKVCGHLNVAATCFNMGSAPSRVPIFWPHPCLVLAGFHQTSSLENYSPWPQVCGQLIICSIVLQ